MPYYIPPEKREGERKYWKDLNDNFEDHVEKYRQEKLAILKQGKKEEVEQELKRHQGYMDIYRKGNVSDHQLSIKFRLAKIEVLKEILEKE